MDKMVWVFLRSKWCQNSIAKVEYEDEAPDSSNGDQAKIKAVSLIVRNNSMLSVRRIARITVSKKSTIHTTLKNDLGFCAFKPQPG